MQVEQFRLRCYMSSLQTSELPNPKVRGEADGGCQAEVDVRILKIEFLSSICSPHQIIYHLRRRSQIIFRDKNIKSLFLVTRRDLLVL